MRALIEIYGGDARGHEVLAHFNYVACNSGGSLVAAGLIENLSLNTLMGLFTDARQRSRLFSELPWYRKSLLRLADLGPKYSAQQKLVGLKSLLQVNGATPLPKIVIVGNDGQPVRFSFMTYDYQRDRAKHLRSFNSLAGSFGSGLTNMTLAEAVHASTNAPVNYFDAPAQPDTPPANRMYWDGGITGYNNPVLAAVVEAIANGSTPQSIGVLSLGTGTTFLPLADDGPFNPPCLGQAPPERGTFADLRKLAKSVLADPPDAASFIAHMMIEGALPNAKCEAQPTPIVRMNPLIQPTRNAAGLWQLPKGLVESEFRDLVKLDMDATAQAEVDLIQKLGDAWIANDVNNQPIRATTNMACEIGHPTFAAAKSAWAQL